MKNHKYISDERLESLLTTIRNPDELRGKCLMIEPFLQGFLNNELSPAMRREVEDHLDKNGDNCHSCYYQMLSLEARALGKRRKERMEGITDWLDGLKTFFQMPVTSAVTATDQVDLENPPFTPSLYKGEAGNLSLFVYQGRVSLRFVPSKVYDSLRLLINDKSHKMEKRRMFYEYEMGSINQLKKTNYDISLSGDDMSIDCAVHFQKAGEGNNYLSACFKLEDADFMTGVYNRDGSLIVATTGNGEIIPIDALTKKPRRILSGHSDSVVSVQFSLNGKLMATGSFDKTVKLWNPNTGETLKTFDGHSDAVISVSFSPDGNKILSGSLDGTVKIWDCITGDCLKTIVTDCKEAEAWYFSPDGATIVSASREAELAVWNADRGVCIKHLHGHTDMITSVVVSPDGKQVISTSRDDTIRQWDIATGECLRTIEMQGVTTAAYQNGMKRLAAASANGLILEFDVETGAVSGELYHDTEEITAIAYSPDDSKILSVSEDELREWVRVC